MLMRRLVIEEAFWNLFPSSVIAVAVARNVDNRWLSRKGEVPSLPELLQEATARAEERFRDVELAGHAAVAPWREAYKRFGAPKGNRSSIEALLRRVKNGKPLPSINPLVDLYNMVSLSFALPCGGEDLDVSSGDVRLTLARGDELFVPLGSETNEPPLPGEVVYADDEGILCRCWNWREAERTKLTEATRNALLCIEGVDDSFALSVAEAMEELAEQVRCRLGGEVRTALLRRENPFFDLE